MAMRQRMLGCEVARNAWRKSCGRASYATVRCSPEWKDGQYVAVSILRELWLLRYGFVILEGMQHRLIGQRKFPVGDRGDFIFTLIFAVPTGSGRKRRGRRPGTREGCKSPRRGGAHTVQCGHVPLRLVPSSSDSSQVTALLKAHELQKAEEEVEAAFDGLGILGHVIFKHCPFIFKSCGM